VLALMVSAVSLSAVLVFGSNQLDLPVWSFTLLLVIFSLVFLLSLALIWVHEQQPNNKTFQVSYTNCSDEVNRPGKTKPQILYS